MNGPMQSDFHNTHRTYTVPMLPDPCQASYVYTLQALRVIVPIRLARAPIFARRTPTETLTSTLLILLSRARRASRRWYRAGSQRSRGRSGRRSGRGRRISGLRRLRGLRVACTIPHWAAGNNVRCRFLGSVAVNVEVDARV